MKLSTLFAALALAALPVRGATSPGGTLNTPGATPQFAFPVLPKTSNIYVGSFIGDGVGLNNLNGAHLQSGTVTPDKTTFVSFAGSTANILGGLDIAANRFLGAGNPGGDFIGNAAGLTNFPPGIGSSSHYYQNLSLKYPDLASGTFTLSTGNPAPIYWPLGGWSQSSQHAQLDWIIAPNIGTNLILNLLLQANSGNSSFVYINVCTWGLNHNDGSNLWIPVSNLSTNGYVLTVTNSFPNPTNRFVSVGLWGSTGYADLANGVWLLQATAQCY